MIAGPVMTALIPVVKMAQLYVKSIELGQEIKKINVSKYQCICFKVCQFVSGGIGVF
jgi:hypothetical protein